MLVYNPARITLALLIITNLIVPLLFSLSGVSTLDLRVIKYVTCFILFFYLGIKTLDKKIELSFSFAIGYKLQLVLVLIALFFSSMDIIGFHGFEQYIKLLGGLKYVLLFYNIFAKKTSRVILFIACLAILIEINKSGMFTHATHVILLAYVLWLSNKKHRGVVLFKTLIMAIPLFIVFQSFKHDFRRDIKEIDSTSSNIVLSAMKSDLSSSFEFDNALIAMNRLNQGLLVQNTIRRVQHSGNYGYGARLLEILYSSPVPRFIWTTKPNVGDNYNVATFLGDTTSYSKGHSYNIGLIGESFAHFGWYGLCLAYIQGLLLTSIGRWFLKNIQEHIVGLLFILPAVGIFFQHEGEFGAIYSTFIKTFMLVNVILILKRSLWH